LRQAAQPRRRIFITPVEALAEAKVVKNADQLQGAFWSTSRQVVPLIKRPRVPSYRVGEPLVVGRSRWPEGVQYGFGVEGHELTVFASAVPPRLVDDVRRGRAEFALIGDAPVFLLAYRLGDSGDWNAASFGWHLQHAGSRVVPTSDPSPDARALLWISLVGADDGIIHAQRGIALAPDFTRALHGAIRTQAASPFDPLECMLTLSELLRDTPGLSRRIERSAVRTLANA
jgi:hypothetical protein